MNIIEELRKFDGEEHHDINDVYEEISALLYDYGKEYSVDVVHEEFEEGGRWSNWKAEVYQVTLGEEIAYFQLYEEVPATEMQEGQERSWGFDEVRPMKITKTIYV